MTVLTHPIVTIDREVMITVKTIANGVKGYIEQAGGSIEVVKWPKSIRYTDDYTTAIYEDVVPDQPLRRGEKIPGEIKVTLPAGTLHRQDDFSQEGVKWVRYAWMLPTGVILGWVDEDTPASEHLKVNPLPVEGMHTFETPENRAVAKRLRTQTWKEYFGF